MEKLAALQRALQSTPCDVRVFTRQPLRPRRLALRDGLDDRAVVLERDDGVCLECGPIRREHERTRRGERQPDVPLDLLLQHRAAATSVHSSAWNTSFSSM